MDWELFSVRTPLLPVHPQRVFWTNSHCAWPLSDLPSPLPLQVPWRYDALTNAVEWRESGKGDVEKRLTQNKPLCFNERGILGQETEAGIFKQYQV